MAFARASAFGPATETSPSPSHVPSKQAVTYGPNPGDTIVGGATARIQGGGRDQTGYAARPGGQAREGRVGVLQGGGRDAAVQYLDGNPHRWAGTAADTDDRGHGG